MNNATSSTLEKEQYGEWLRTNNIRTITRTKAEEDVMGTLGKWIKEITQE